MVCYILERNVSILHSRLRKHSEFKIEMQEFPIIIFKINRTEILEKNGTMQCPKFHQKPLVQSAENSNQMLFLYTGRQKNSCTRRLETFL
jgi:hypothetical protein